MNANDFFEQYSIEIINKRTRISPITLRYIKNKEFEKIQRVKFLGFIRIIEKEFSVDLSELVEEYNQITNHTPSENEEIELKEPKKHNTLILFILTVILFAIGAYLLYTQYSSPKSKNTNEINKSAFSTLEENSKKTLNSDVNDKFSEKNKTLNKTLTDKNISKPAIAPKTKTEKKNTAPKTIEIYPNEKVWFRAVNLDTNKTVEYLTSKPKTLKGANWYIKFGHGNITINYANQTITPNTKKIIRILFKNGKTEYLKKPNRYEK